MDEQIVDVINKKLDIIHSHLTYLELSLNIVMGNPCDTCEHYVIEEINREILKAKEFLSNNA